MKPIKHHIRLLFTGLALLWLTPSVATHLAGGEITYEWISGNTYKVKLSLYVDCSGLPAPGTATIAYQSASCAFSGGTVTLNPSGPFTIITPLCPSVISQSACNGGNMISLKEQKYEGQVILPGNCTDWEFTYTSCCRNGSSSNLIDPDNYDLFVSAHLNNFDVPFNNSVRFGGIPVNKIFNGSTNYLNWNGYDIDGDSVIFELAGARGANGVLIPYSPGYSFMQPFLSSLPTSINAGNGIISITPNAIQAQVLVIRVSEYRNGFYIGSIYRDLMVTAINTTNNLPSLSGINGTGVFTTFGCPGTPIQFTVYSNDPDPGQNLTISMNANGTSASLISVPGPNPISTFMWTPSPGDISPLPYTFVISVKDDNCNYYATQNYAFQVYVNPCNTNDVWPGDANADGTANLYDLLAIGMAFNDAGPVRPSASINWIAQPCPDWTNTFPSGINHKHADTDGNGTVNFGDTTALSVNFGLTHPRLAGSTPGTASTDISVTASADTVGLLATVHFDIAMTTPVDSIYGLAFRLFLDPALIDGANISVSYPLSAFGTNGVDMVSTDRWSNATGMAEIALSRINQQNIMATGPVARVTIVTTDNVSGKVSMAVVPFDVLGITIAGDTLSLNGVGDEVVIDPAFVGIPDVPGSHDLLVYPVPASGIVFVESMDSFPYDLSVIDARGREIMHLINEKVKSVVDVSTLPKGIYTLRSESVYGVNIKKLVIF